MSELGDYYPTLTDVQKTLDPNGKPARMIQMLSQSNPILKYATWMPTNQSTTHMTSVITSLPTASVVGFNEGSTPTKETGAQSVEGTCIVEQWSEVAVRLANLATNVGEFRVMKAGSFLESMNQKMAQLFFYGNASLNIKEVNGLATRYASTSATNGQNVILGGGAGSDNMSIFLAGFGMNKVNLIYPKNSQAGMRHEDKGVETKENAGGTTGALMEVYRDLWEWMWGICVEDWRYVVRIANIDYSAQVAQSSAADLTDLMMQAYGCIPSTEGAKLVWFMPRALYVHFSRQRRSDVSAGGGLTYENVDGKFIPYFMGFPIAVCDALTNAETLIS